MFTRDAITRQEYRNLVSLIGQCPRQRSDRIGQYAGLDVGKQLTGCVDDFHRSNLHRRVSYANQKTWNALSANHSYHDPPRPPPRQT